MYISRNSIVIKTNYETRRRDRGVARRRAGCAREECSGSIRFVRSLARSFVEPAKESNRLIEDRQTRTIVVSRPEIRAFVNQTPTSRPVAKIQRCLLATIRPTYELSTFKPASFYYSNRLHV